MGVTDVTAKNIKLLAIRAYACAREQKLYLFLQFRNCNRLVAYCSGLFWKNFALFEANISLLSRKKSLVFRKKSLVFRKKSLVS